MLIKETSPSLKCFVYAFSLNTIHMQELKSVCLTCIVLAEQLQQDEQSWQDHSQADLHMVLMKCFVHLMREQHMQRVQLLSRGLTHVKHLPFSASMPCCR